MEVQQAQPPAQSAPQEVQSSAPEADAGPSDGVGLSQDAARQLGEKRNAEIDARRRAIVEAARAKIKAEFRQAQGLPEPVSQPVEPAVLQNTAPTSQAPQVANPSALAEAFTAQLNSQYAEASRMKAEAAQMAEAATRRATEAEAKLKTFLANPTSFLEAEGLDMDAWQARLLNGGTPTAEERLKAELTAAFKAETQPLLQQVSQLKQELHTETVGKALNELTPVLTEKFPFINTLLGPQAALEEIKRQAQVGGRPVTPADITQMLTKLEDGFVAQYQATLRNPTLATRLGVSVPSPQDQVAASQSPQTLTNRVTSSVNSASTRATSDQDRKARGRELIRKLLATGQAI